MARANRVNLPDPTPEEREKVKILFDVRGAWVRSGVSLSEFAFSIDLDENKTALAVSCKTKELSLDEIKDIYKRIKKSKFGDLLSEQYVLEGLI